jgi:hypothetical protein
MFIFIPQPHGRGSVEALERVVLNGAEVVQDVQHDDELREDQHLEAPFFARTKCSVSKDFPVQIFSQYTDIAVQNVQSVRILQYKIFSQCPGIPVLNVQPVWIFQYKMFR